ncbi:hypothetical protein TNCV_381911 [Trichonephila clavipes]|nr:hypothetical protein TNCV_381911 [Trichonephila clavipes]
MINSIDQEDPFVTAVDTNYKFRPIVVSYFDCAKCLIQSGLFAIPNFIADSIRSVILACGLWAACFPVVFSEWPDNGDVSMHGDTLTTCPSTEDKHLRCKITKKLKLTRKPKDLCTESTICKTDTTLGVEKVASHMVSNGLKNACDELKQSNKVTVSYSPCKRKIEMDTNEKEGKIFKLDASPDTSISKVESGIGNKENEQKYAVKNLQSFIDHSKVLVSHSTPAIPDTVNNTTLSKAVSDTAVESNQHTHVSLSASFMSDENELNFDKKIKRENSDRSMLDEFERLLGDEDMNIEEIETSPDDDILLEVEQFLDS